jgi:mutator protein MutT
MSAEAPVRVVACVIERDGKYLITKRLKHSHLGHLWEFPGGKVEPGETLEQCAVRECQEEIGVEVKPLKLVQEIVHDYPERSVRLYFIACELISGAPRAIHCADWRWVKPDELKNFEFPAADKKIIEGLVKAGQTPAIG